jgi:hypothetical protein
MNDKSMPDVLYIAHQENFSSISRRPTLHGTQYTRTQAIIELLDGMKRLDYDQKECIETGANNLGYDEALDDAIQAIKDMK